MTGSVYDDDGFAHYIVESNETPVAYVAVVSLFVAVSVSIAAPIACWSRERARQRQMGGTVAPTAETAERTEQHPSRSESSPEMVSDLVCVQPHLDSSKVATLSVFHREHLAAMKQLAQEKLSSLHHKARVSDTNIADRLSAVPSVASSTQIHAQRRTFLSRMPWSHGRTLPRSDTVQRFVQLERQSQVSGEGSHSGRSFNSWAAGQSQLTGVRCVSDAGRTFLDGEAIKGEAQHYRLRYIKQYRNHDKRSLRHESTRKYSLGGRSCDGSVMPPLDPDAVSPHDAADANDPGQLFNPIQYKAHNATLTDQTSQSLQPQRAILAQFSNILDLAEVNYESKRILSLAIPSTIGAMADPLCRIVLVSIISHFIDTDSMVAYLLVILFLRLTTHGISGAIVDAETNMVQDALDRGGDLGLFQAGQTIQLAIFFQVIIGGPILLIWVFVMENVVDWLVSDNKIAEIASTYTSVIIIEYVLKGVSKSFMLPFDLTGQAQFEAHVELLATIMTGIAIAIVATTNDLSLPAIGWIQVIMGIAKAIMKVAFVALRGWLLPYRIGLWKDCAIKVSLCRRKVKSSIAVYSHTPIIYL